jgi:hypothetical protein
MCLLTYFPAQALLDAHALRTGARFNNDGHGFAVVADDRLIVEHGMEAEPLIEAFAAVRSQFPDGPALFHSRFATHGSVGLDNCHPFLVGGDTRTVLAHNGVLPKNVQPLKGDERSDTRIAAEDYLPKLGPLQKRQVRAYLERWMTGHSKAVILSVDPRFGQRAYLLNERSGIWDHGVWYSNDGYLPDDWYGEPFDGTGYEALGLVQCESCLSVIDVVEIECSRCGWCFGCGQPDIACQCWAPPILRAGRRNITQ